MEGSEINKLIDNLYKECIIHEQMPVEYQLGMEIFLRRLKQSVSAIQSIPVNEVKEDSEKDLYEDSVYTEVIHIVEMDNTQCELYLDTLKKLMTRFTITRKIKEEDKPIK